MSRVLVTGATGHIGANVVRELLAADYDVVPLVRPSSERIGLAGLGLEAAVGDILDPDSIRSAVEGCEHVIHAGAVYATWARDARDILRPAIEGTRNVVQAAKDAGVKRVVHTSSVAAVGYCRDPERPYDERRWNAHATNPYIRGKTESERLAFELADELGLELVSVLPVGVLGRFDYRKTPTSAGIVDSLAGKGPVIAAGCLTDVRDVARAHVLALEKGRAGERYIAGGDNVSVKAQVRLIEEVTGKRAKQGLAPKAVLWPIAALSEGMAKLTGKPPLITRDAIRDVVGRHFVYDSTKMRTELGLEPRGAQEVLEETARWAAFMGWFSKRLGAEVAQRYPPDSDWLRP